MRGGAEGEHIVVLKPFSLGWLKPLIIQESSVLSLQVDNIGLRELRIDVDHRVLARHRDVLNVYHQIWISSDNSLTVNELDSLAGFEVDQYKFGLKHLGLYLLPDVVLRKPSFWHEHLCLIISVELHRVDVTVELLSLLDLQRLQILLDLV